MWFGAILISKKFPSRVIDLGLNTWSRLDRCTVERCLAPVSGIRLLHLSQRTFHNNRFLLCLGVALAGLRSYLKTWGWSQHRGKQKRDRNNYIDELLSQTLRPSLFTHILAYNKKHSDLMFLLLLKTHFSLNDRGRDTGNLDIVNKKPEVGRWLRWHEGYGRGLRLIIQLP